VSLTCTVTILFSKCTKIMKAVFIKEKGSFDNVVVEEISKPVIAADEILVKIKTHPTKKHGRITRYALKLCILMLTTL